MKKKHVEPIDKLKVLAEEIMSCLQCIELKTDDESTYWTMHHLLPTIRILTEME